MVREAALGLSLKKIGDAVETGRSTRDAIAADKPALSFMRAGAKREHAEKLREAEESLAIFEAAARELSVSIPSLQACVERSLENYLREYDPEYVNGLSASRFYTDWQRVLARFDKAVEVYLSLLGRLTTKLEALVPNEPCGAHFDGRQLVEETAARALIVWDEIRFLNKVADVQRTRAGTATSPMTRQRERKWPAQLTALLTVQPLAAAKTLKTLQAESVEVIEQVRSSVMEQCRLAKYAGGYGVASYHEHTWTVWRTEAFGKIAEGDLERIVAETSDRIQAGKLQEWAPERVESPPGAEEEAASSVSGRPNTVQMRPKTPPAAAPAAVAPANVPPPPPPPPPPAPEPVVIPVKSLSLRRSGGASSEPATPAAVPVAVSAPSGAGAGTAPPLDAATLAQVKAERERMEALLHETKTSLNEREQFLSQSEARLMQTSQAQIEREMELEQKEEQLRALEKRLRELQPGAVPPPPDEKKTFDEFNE